MSEVAYKDEGKIEVTISQEDIDRGYLEFTYRHGKDRKVFLSRKTWVGAVWVCWEKGCE